MPSGKMSEKADMRRVNKTSLNGRVADILHNNEGASLVLVTIIAIIVVTSIVVLSVNVNTLWASADKQYYQDQAYEASKSLGSAIDTLISNQKLTLADYSGTVMFSDEFENIHVKARVEDRGSGYYDVIVTAKTPNEESPVAEYAYTATYYGSGKTYTRVN